jgi:hypothetical protein
LSDLSDKVVLTYLLNNKNGVRNDEELVELKNAIDDYKDKLNNISKTHEEYSSKADDVKNNADSVNENNKKI